MIETAILCEEPWPRTIDWEAIAARAVEAAIAAGPHGGWSSIARSIEVSVRLTGDEAVRALNLAHRGKDAPTNVLSFPMVAPDLFAGLADPEGPEALLGDIVLAHGVCAREAATRGIPIETHASHLIVHGALHLLGYDHLGESEAEAMETIERAALAAIGIGDPYAGDRDDNRE